MITMNYEREKQTKWIEIYQSQATDVTFWTSASRDVRYVD